MNAPEKPPFLTEEMWRVHLDWLGKQENQPEKLEPYDFSDWDNQPVPEQEWTLDNKIPRRQVCLFSGEGAAGKSTIGLHLCAAHALGKDCLQSLAAPGPAFFIDAEDEIGVIHRRLAAIAKHFETSFSDLFAAGLNLFPLAGKDPLMATAGKNGVILPTHLYDEIHRLAVELKPQTIVVASSANVYAGSEIDRSQVTQFINLLTRLAIAADGSVVLISHPSLTGIANDSGISGSTQWHNATRARLVLKTVPQDHDENALRLLECKKNQYAPPSAAITLEYRDGMFLPKPDPSSFDRAVRASQADDAFRDCLAECDRDGAIVSATPKSNNYAPNVFARTERGIKLNLGKDELAAAMARALASGGVHIERYGRPANPHFKISAGPA